MRPRGGAAGAARMPADPQQLGLLGPARSVNRMLRPATSEKPRWPPRKHDMHLLLPLPGYQGRSRRHCPRCCDGRTVRRTVRRFSGACPPGGPDARKEAWRRQILRDFHDFHPRFFRVPGPGPRRVVRERSKRGAKGGGRRIGKRSNDGAAVKHTIGGQGRGPRSHPAVEEPLSQEGGMMTAGHRAARRPQGGHGHQHGRGGGAHGEPPSSCRLPA